MDISPDIRFGILPSNQLFNLEQDQKEKSSRAQFRLHFTLSLLPDDTQFSVVGDTHMYKH